MQGLHRLLDRRLVVEAVALQHVDIVEAEALERALDRGKDALRSSARAHPLIGALALRERPRWLAKPAGPRSSALPSGPNVLVRMTTLSRGILCCLRNFPRMISDSPAE